MEEHNLKRLLELGLCATVNSDDPAYFGGYMNENLLAAYKALNLSRNDIYCLIKNSFNAAFLTDDQKTEFINELDDYVLNKQ